MEQSHLFVIKRNGERELFSREKLRSGIIKSCQKRPVSSAQIDELVSAVEEDCRKSRSGEIQSTRIGEYLMQRLKRVDKIAYIRFASVYLDFKDPEDFAQAMRDVKKKA
jgi:transcriptional repressor NrdR